MKNFKVKVDNNKAEFFKELMDSFKFVSYEEVDSFREPRVYPGGEFEIRSPKDTTPITYSMEKAGRKLEQESKGKPTQTREQSLEDIKKALSKIEALRNRR